MNEQKKYTILYVDDEELNLRIFKNTFRKDYNILTATSGLDGLNLLEKENVDLILTDQRMPGMTGIDFLRKAIERNPDLNRILVTAYSDYEILKEAVNEVKIFQYVEKPWKEEDIKITIDSALEIHRLQKENIKLNQFLQAANDELTSSNESLKTEIELHKKTQKELIKEKEYAEQCNRLKSAFLANMSHEIRTPMNSIIGFSGILHESVDDPCLLRKYLDIIEKSSWQLLTIVSDIIEISKIDTGNLEMKLSPIDLNPLIEKVFYQNQSEYANNGPEFVLDSILPFGSSSVLGEYSAIVKVLNNLINNAFKFTEEGSVHLGAKILDNQILVYVKDTGIGIASEDYNLIFDRFSQVDSSKTKRQGGNGLGLAIAKAYVEEMKGKIWVESCLNEGSTFFFVLPLLKSI
jgi:signal transduction histidine kinase